MSSNLYECFMNEKCGSEDCSKMTKFWANTTSHSYRSGNIDDDSDLLKNIITGDESWAMTLKPKPNHPNSKRFATIEEIKEKSRKELLAIPKSSFQKCFDDWKKRWHKCIISERCCFEGDKIVIEKYINTFWKKI